MVLGLQRASTEVQERVTSGAPLIVKGEGQGPTRLFESGELGVTALPTDIWARRRQQHHTHERFLIYGPILRRDQSSAKTLSVV